MAYFTKSVCLIFYFCSFIYFNSLCIVNCAYFNNKINGTSNQHTLSSLHLSKINDQEKELKLVNKAQEIQEIKQVKTLQESKFVNTAHKCNVVLENNLLMKQCIQEKISSVSRFDEGLNPLSIYCDIVLDLSSFSDVETGKQGNYTQLLNVEQSESDNFVHVLKWQKCNVNSKLMTEQTIDTMSQQVPE